MPRAGYIDAERREQMFRPHLNRWAALGLITKIERLDSATAWPRWRLTWWDGKVTTAYDSAVRFAIIAVDSLERKLSHDA